ncbi:MAG: hypothetical protein IMZ60_02005, partial [Actinobacteria bacterium]|nr:hypothetical protein [Actinomycetota bacterium]
MEKQTTKDWEEDFYESSWKPDTITDLSDMDKKFIEELTNFLPRHMDIYDWNLPYAEEI